ncbi:MAG: hypothetical protein H7A33_04845 [Deltaproteobacteria bacterium]|nr:hypothetical protein [Deltaproteobacteria bacterium]
MTNFKTALRLLLGFLLTFLFLSCSPGGSSLGIDGTSSVGGDGAAPAASDYNEIESDILDQIGSDYDSEGIIVTDIPVTPAKLGKPTADALKLSFEEILEPGLTSSVFIAEAYAGLSELSADASAVVHLRGSEGSVSHPEEAQLKIYLPGNQASTMLVDVEEDGSFDVALPESFLIGHAFRMDVLCSDPAKKNQSTLIGAESLNFVYDQDSESYFIDILPDLSGVSGGELAVFDQLIFYNRTKAGQSMIEAVAFSGGVSLKIANTPSTLEQFSFFPSLTSNQVKKPAVVIGVDTDKDVIVSSPKFDAYTLIESRNDRTVLDENGDVYQPKVSLAPDSAGEVAFAFGSVVKNEVVPFVLAPIERDTQKTSTASKNNILFYDPTHPHILGRDLTWKDKDYVIAFSKMTLDEEEQQNVQVANLQNMSGMVMGDIGFENSENPEASTLVAANENEMAGDPANGDDDLDVANFNLNESEEESPVRYQIQMYKVSDLLQDSEVVGPPYDRERGMYSLKPALSSSFFKNEIRNPVASDPSSNKLKPYLAFNYVDDAGYSQIAISDYEHVRLLTPDASQKGKPTISKDGTFMAFAVEREEGKTFVVIIHLPTMQYFWLGSPENRKAFRSNHPQFSSEIPFAMNYNIVAKDGSTSVGVINLQEHPVGKKLIEYNDSLESGVNYLMQIGDLRPYSPDNL